MSVFVLSKNAEKITHEVRKTITRELFKIAMRNGIDTRFIDDSKNVNDAIDAIAGCFAFLIDNVKINKGLKKQYKNFEKNKQFWEVIKKR